MFETVKFVWFHFKLATCFTLSYFVFRELIFLAFCVLGSPLVWWNFLNYWHNFFWFSPFNWRSFIEIRTLIWRSCNVFYWNKIWFCFFTKWLTWKMRIFHLLLFGIFLLQQCLPETRKKFIKYQFKKRGRIYIYIWDKKL